MELSRIIAHTGVLDGRTAASRLPICLPSASRLALSCLWQLALRRALRCVVSQLCHPCQQKSHPYGWLFCWQGWQSCETTQRNARRRASCQRQLSAKREALGRQIGRRLAAVLPSSTPVWAIILDNSIDKPGSVVNGHLSARCVATALRDRSRATQGICAGQASLLRCCFG